MEAGGRSSYPKTETWLYINMHLRPIMLAHSNNNKINGGFYRRTARRSSGPNGYPNEFGGIPKSSTVQALTSTFRHWTEATKSDAPGGAFKSFLTNARRLT